MGKTKGQLAYEEDCRARPTYDTGQTRAAWGELEPWVQASWQKNPTPRWSTHGSPELDEDARKLEAMGQDAGPTLADIEPEQVANRAMQAMESLIVAAQMMLMVIEANQTAWEGEEDSVKEEHADLIAMNAKVLAASKNLGGL